jgi:hypothetical protein
VASRAMSARDHERIIVETFFLVEEKRAIRTQNFQDLFC